MSSWLVALRIARREARRAKGRSGLVVALIGVPALALTFAAVTNDMFTLTTEERLARDLGTADAKLTWYGSPVTQRDARGWVVEAAASEDAPEAAPDAGRVQALVATAEHIVTLWESFAVMTTSAGRGELSAFGIDLADPLVSGSVRLTGGRAPAADREVALTAAAADRLGTGIGDQVETADASERYLVVGTVEFPESLSMQAMVFHPEHRPSLEWWAQWLVDTSEPVTWDQVQALNRHGFVVYSRDVVLHPPAEVEDVEQGGAAVATFGVAVLVGGLGLLEIVLLAGPAFAIGVRRRQRQLGLVGAAGGTPAHLRRIVLGDGVVLGALGAVAGIGIGIAAAFLARPLVEQYLTDTRAGGWRVFPLALAGIAVVAVSTGVLAAAVPAFAAARQPVVATLAGRRGISGSRRRWLVLGLVMVAFGAAITSLGAWQVSSTVVLAGLVLGQLGLVLCTPKLIGLVARLGSRLPLAPRIALRDTARNRSSAAPAISAVMAAVAGAAGAGMLVIAFQHPGTVTYSTPPGTVYAAGPWTDPFQDAGPDGATVADVERAARATLPVDQVRQVSQAVCRGEPEDQYCYLQVEVPEENRCPYWTVSPLSAADQRAARRDPRCDEGQEEGARFVEYVDDGTALDVLTGADADEVAAAAAVLRDGGVVVTNARYLDRNGNVALRATFGDDTGEELGDPVTVPGHLLPVDIAELHVVIASPEAVRALRLEVMPGPLLISTTRMPTREEEDALSAAMESLQGYGYVIRDVEGEVPPMLMVLAGAAGLIALGAAAIATGLAAADRRPDLSTLGAVGASPRVRRSLSLSQSGVIAGLGTGLGLVAGLGAATAVLVALNQRYASVWPAPEPYPITVPWIVVGVLLVVPVIAMLGAGLLTRSRLPIERRPA